MKSYACPIVGTVDDVLKVNGPKPSEFYGMEVEEYLNLNFGRGTWVRDHAEDVYIVFVEEKGDLKYIVIDRDFRRYPVTIERSRLN
jgi:hypothetical protein